MEQRTREWFEARRGMLTASEFRKVMNGTPKGWNSYMRRLRAELAGAEIDRFDGRAVRWGIDNEPRARAAFALERGVTIEPAGFVIHPQHFHIGASPDGWDLTTPYGGRIGWEVKCPWNSDRHQRCWYSGMPDEHIPQVQGSMWVTGAPAWWFVSFDPRLYGTSDDDLALFAELIPRDEEYIARLSEKLLDFHKKMMAGWTWEPFDPRTNEVPVLF